MKISKLEGIAAAPAVVVAIASLSAPSYADSSSTGAVPSGYPWISLAGQPWVNYTTIAPLLTATFTNQSPSQMNATAYATLHDLVGQTVAIDAVAIVGANPGQNTTVGFYFAVPLDAYTVDLFVLSSSGTAKSAVTNGTNVA